MVRRGREEVELVELLYVVGPHLRVGGMREGQLVNNPRRSTPKEETGPPTQNVGAGRELAYRSVSATVDAVEGRSSRRTDEI